MKGLPNSQRLLLSAMLLLSVGTLAHAQPNLGTGELRIAGVRLVVAPATQTLRVTSGQALPRSQATGLTVTREDPAHPGPVLPAALFGTFTVGDELSGPEFAEVA